MHPDDEMFPEEEPEKDSEKEDFDKGFIDIDNEDPLIAFDDEEVERSEDDKGLDFNH